MIQLDEKQLNLIKSILKKYIPNRKVIAFGSRVKGSAKPFSDLDLCIMGQPLTFEELAKLREEFSNSDLIIKIDIVEWEKIDAQFQNVISRCQEAILVGNGC